MSMEADIAIRDDVDARKADAVDGAIGELSQFHETYGYALLGPLGGRKAIGRPG